jgi:hypothetical protein
VKHLSPLASEALDDLPLPPTEQHAGALIALARLHDEAAARRYADSFRSQSLVWAIVRPGATALITNTFERGIQSLPLARICFQRWPPREGLTDESRTSGVMATAFAARKAAREGFAIGRRASTRCRLRQIIGS